MKVAASDQYRLLDLVEVDRTILRLAHSRTVLSEHDEIKNEMVGYRALSEELVGAETALSDAQFMVDRVDSDLEPAQARLAKNKQISTDGSITDAKSLQSILAEIDHLGGRIDKLEEQKLAAMEDLEAAQRTRDDIAQRRDQIEQHVRALMASRDEKVAAINAKIADNNKTRAAIAKTIAPQLVDLYLKIAKRTGDVGAGELVNGVCTGCGLALNPTDLTRYAAASADEVCRCEECGRIIVRRSKSV